MSRSARAYHALGGARARRRQFLSPAHPLNIEPPAAGANEAAGPFAPPGTPGQGVRWSASVTRSVNAIEASAISEAVARRGGASIMGAHRAGGSPASSA
jgi:hypothetical protein